MRKFACFLLLAGGMAALPAAETWRWRDANGVVHFSDRPVPGAERVELGSAPKPGSTSTAARTAGRPAQEPAIVPYTRCVLLAPVNDQVLLNETSVQVSLDLQPALQGSHQIRMLFNGQPAPGWSATSTQGSLTNLVRGTHTLVASVLDDFGRSVCTSPLVSFHVRLPTVPLVRPTPH